MAVDVKDIPEKSLLRPDEVAQIFQCSKNTVYRWVDEGKIKGINPTGGMLRITRESIVVFISTTFE